MEFRAITTEDLAYMEKYSKEPDCYKETPDKDNFDYALVHENETLAVGGFKLMNRHTAVCWFEISDAGRKNIVASVRAIKEFSDGYTDSDGKHQTGFFEEMNISRAEAYVKVGYEEGVRFVEHCNFSLERRVMSYFGLYPADVYVKFFDWG